MIVPIPNVAPGGVTESSWGNAVADSINRAMPRTRLRRAALLALAAGVDTSIPWTVEDVDTNGFHAANSTDVVIPAGYGGVYLVTYSLTVSAGTPAAWIETGGNRFAQSVANASLKLDGSALLELAAGSTVVLRMFNAAAINVVTNAADYFAVARVGNT